MVVVVVVVVVVVFFFFFALASDESSQGFAGFDRSRVSGEKGADPSWQGRKVYFTSCLRTGQSPGTTVGGL